ncbi:RICIN domain-containing protein [Actinomadura rupiterrae]|uniref:RICIN domain-containing protein n=1 Tax=Actinomadura rupiterrae TaxID=559627 RepID=UPI0020A2B530|nr:hypothetical protein [Actinomadura rupiterrae]MCP2338890.1 hypothetical protein [Actinomadura rupiterrae]
MRRTVLRAVVVAFIGTGVAATAATAASAETYLNKSSDTNSHWGYIGVYADPVYNGASVQTGFDPQGGYNTHANWGKAQGSYGLYIYPWSNTNYTMEDHGWGGSGAKVDAWQRVDQANVQWRTYSLGGSYFAFKSARTDVSLCIDNPGQAATDKQQQMYTCNGSAAQAFS